MVYRVEGPTTRFSDKLMKYLQENHRVGSTVAEYMYDFIVQYMPILNEGFMKAQYTTSLSNGIMTVKGRIFDADLLIRGIHCEGMIKNGVVECGRFFYEYINDKLVRVGYVAKGRKIITPTEIWEVGNPIMEEQYKRKVHEILS